MNLATTLDHAQVSSDPTPQYMGELPWDYAKVPARVVVNLCGVFPGSSPLGTVVFSLPMHDVLDPALLPERGTFETFLASVHPFATREAAYWHCHAGINRSGFALAAYLHLHRGLPISQAIAELRAHRGPVVLCNNLFEETLRRWYGTPDEQAFEPVPIEQYLVGRTGNRDDW